MMRETIISTVSSIPLYTAFFSIWCIGVYVLSIFTSIVGISIVSYLGLTWFSLTQNPLQIYRWITYTWVHLSILHVLLNCMAFLTIGSFMEKKLGTLKFFHITILFTLLAAMTSHLVCFLVPWFRNDVLAGNSGLLFSMLVYESVTRGPQKVLGLFTISGYVLPLVFLAITTLLMPEASFLGHLLGVSLGYIYVFGWFDFVIPSSEKFERLEEKLSWLSSSRRFQKAENDASVFLPIHNTPVTLPWSTPTDPATRFAGTGYRLGG